MHLFRLVVVLSLLLVSIRAADDPLAGYAPGYVTLVRNAIRSFVQRDFETTLSLIDQADQIVPATPMALNIRGAVAIEQKQFDVGRKYCIDALRTDPKFYPARFNLAEIPFVQGKYAEARALLERMLEDHPKDDLLMFRIYLTYLLEKDETAAKEHLDQIPFLSNTPVYYFAQGAWEFAHGNEKEGRAWIERGHYVFPPHKSQNFIEVFFDLGWLKRGSEAGTVAAEAAPAPFSDPGTAPTPLAPTPPAAPPEPAPTAPPAE